MRKDFKKKKKKKFMGNNRVCMVGCRLGKSGVNQIVDSGGKTLEVRVLICFLQTCKS